ncbi:hypothetical protein VN97_g1236 [Penicillium thymicola]|uniref:Uncharacterized protein n=1 Tax=Penicillium thymicola TaxID=293382 RepID=A0AAI9TRC6_PENTH|nr:hypothetical protein VN97_g1236 [Penicillium thymicola]
MGATSLSVIARKAAERVVAQLDGDEGGWRASPPVIALAKRLSRSNASVCEHAEGSRTCGGLVLFSFKGRVWGTSLSVNVRKAAERVVAQLEW